MVEIWNKGGSGILRQTPLLLRACMAGAYGSRIQYETGAVCQAHFTYLCGAVDRGVFEERPELFFDKLLVCMSSDWEGFIQKQPALDAVLLRRMMKPLCKGSSKALPVLPSSYRLRSFDADAFNAHPYGHGFVYGDYESFSRRGSGAVMWHGDKIVASASSHLTFENEVELDVTTDAEHRRKGLADHCVAAMMNDCAARIDRSLGREEHAFNEYGAESRIRASAGIRSLYVEMMIS